MRAVDRLSALDTVFLDIEDADEHVSTAIASVSVIEGPPPSRDELLRAFGPRTALIPRARQVPRRVPWDLARPAWVDTAEPDLDYHVRRVALPAPGGDAELCDLVGTVMSQRLDRERPLWECWVIEGLAGGRWAVLTKVHHCMLDGMSGSHLHEVLFDGVPGSDLTVPSPPSPATQPPSVLAQGLHLARTLLSPTGALGLARTSIATAAGLAGLLAGILLPAASTSLIGPLGRYRRYRVARASLAELHEIATAFDATLNDVALAALSAGFRAVLHARGEPARADSVRTLVPVSVRAHGHEEALGNEVSAMLAFLPVHHADPVARLRSVRRRLTTLKHSSETEAGQDVTALGNLVPFAPLSLVVKAAARYPQRSVVTVTTNVRGPGHLLAALGRPVVEIFPVVPLAMRFRYGVALFTYAGQMVFGVTGDHDGAPDIEVFTRAVEADVAALLAAARSELGGTDEPAPAKVPAER